MEISTYRLTPSLGPFHRPMDNMLCGVQVQVQKGRKIMLDREFEFWPDVVRNEELG